MLTLKKLQKEINELKAKEDNNEKLKELDIILNIIKKYVENNINNMIFIQAIDLTENYTIINQKTKEQKE